MAYETGDAWVKVMTRLLNPDGESADDKAVDDRVRAIAATLFVPDGTLFNMDGRIGDFGGLVESAHRLRKAADVLGARVVIGIANFVRDKSSDEAAHKVSFTWTIAVKDHPPASGLPPATRPLPPTVEVTVEATLDKSGPEARACIVVAHSRALPSPDSDDDD